VRQRPQPPLTRRERRNIERQERPPRERPTIARSAPRRPVWQSPFAIVTVVALAAAIGIIFINNKPGASSGGALVPPPLTYSAGIVDGENLGKADAPVVLGVYTDFQCPFCGQFVREQFASLKTGFVDSGILRIESHDIDILGLRANDESLELATGARCALDQGRYWAFHDYVFWNQQPENQGAYNAEFIASIAKASGVDMTKWNDCVAGAEARGKVIADTNAAHALGVTSTPTIFLNGGALTPGVPNATVLADRIRQLAAATAAPSSSPTAAPSGSAVP
jgi:protein-disulfide isomerase